MAIEFRCPHCGHQTSVAERNAGQTGPCAGCGQTVTIPAKGGVLLPPARTSGGGTSNLTTLAVVGVSAVLVVGGLAALVLPAMGTARDRSLCCGNLSCIALGLHSYTDTYDCFPPAYTVDESGRPLHSWRVLILPHMDNAALYDQIRLDEPWDSPHNTALAQHMPAFYRCPGHADDGSSHTHYLAIVGQGTAFPGPESVRIRDIVDGLSRTVAVAETTESVHWMEPRDMPFDGMSFTINDPAGHALGGPHTGGVNVLFCDDSLEFLPETVPPDIVRLLLLRDDHEQFDWEDVIPGRIR